MNRTPARTRSSRLTYANVMSTIAVLIALGTGTAWAAGTINGRSIVDRSIQHTKIGKSQVRRENIRKANVRRQHIATGAVDSARIANGTVAAGDLAAVPHVVANDTTTFSVADATWTTLPFASEVVDVGSIHSAATPSRFTARRAGLYLAVARISWLSTAAGLRWIRIVHYSGAGVEIAIYDESAMVLQTPPFSGPHQTNTALVRMKAGEYLQMEVRQDAEPVDGAITIGGDPQFEMAYISAS